MAFKQDYTNTRHRTSRNAFNPYEWQNPFLQAATTQVARSRTFSESIRCHTQTPEVRLSTENHDGNMKRVADTPEDNQTQAIVLSAVNPKRRRTGQQEAPTRRNELVVERRNSSTLHPSNTTLQNLNLHQQVQLWGQTLALSTTVPTIVPISQHSMLLPQAPVIRYQDHTGDRTTKKPEYKLVIDRELTDEIADGFCYYKSLATWGGSYRFSYNRYGVLDDHIRFDHESLKAYLLEHPLGAGLTLRIQKNPVFTGSCGNNQVSSLGLKKQLQVYVRKDEKDKTKVTVPEGLKMSNICRFASCRSKDNYIKPGHPKFCFDEESAREDGTYGLQHNPYRASGYMHIGCFEKAIKLAHVARCFDIKIDIQPTVPEPTSKRASNGREVDYDDNTMADFSPNRFLNLEANVGYRVDRWLWYAESRPRWEPVSLLETLEFVLRCTIVNRRRDRQKLMVNPEAKIPQPVDYLMNTPGSFKNSEDFGCLKWDALGRFKAEKNIATMKAQQEIIEQLQFLEGYCGKLRILQDEYAAAYTHLRESREKGRSGTRLANPLEELTRAISDFMVQAINKKYTGSERVTLLALKAFYDDITRPIPGYELLREVKKWKAEEQRKRLAFGKKPGNIIQSGRDNAENEYFTSISTRTEAQAMALLGKLKERVYTPRIYWLACDLEKNDSWGGGRAKGEKVKKERDSPGKLPIDKGQDCKDWIPEDLEDKSKFPSCSKYPAILKLYENHIDPTGVINSEHENTAVEKEEVNSYDNCSNLNSSLPQAQREELHQNISYKGFEDDGRYQQVDDSFFNDAMDPLSANWDIFDC